MALHGDKLRWLGFVSAGQESHDRCSRDAPAAADAHRVDVTAAQQLICLAKTYVEHLAQLLDPQDVTAVIEPHFDASSRMRSRFAATRCFASAVIARR